MWHPESKNCRKCGPLKKRKIVGNVDPEEVGNVGTPHFIKYSTEKEI